MDEATSIDAHSVRVPFGGSVVWPDECCACSATAPVESVRLEAYAPRWASLDSWLLPLQWHAVPRCARCGRWNRIWWAVRALGALLVFAGATFALAMGNHLHGLGEHAFELLVVAFAVMLGPIVFWLWRRFPIGPTIRVDDGAVVMTFRRTEFARAAVVHAASEASSTLAAED